MNSFSLTKVDYCTSSGPSTQVIPAQVGAVPQWRTFASGRGEDKPLFTNHKFKPSPQISSQRPASPSKVLSYALKSNWRQSDQDLFFPIFFCLLARIQFDWMMQVACLHCTECLSDICKSTPLDSCSSKTRPTGQN